ncbi:hypothetical protein EVAR_82661_1 [Eumeta japonica]|uniref:Uncharacterized protein n=1 Tax=Eumeta variegata TaxID=151549 RepID=A0A4C1VBT1_EUMVA|nr:hypothetical protein EVAR_82661_1 [Eumeta japonica]
MWMFLAVAKIESGLVSGAARLKMSPFFTMTRLARYSVPTQEAADALVTPLWSRMSCMSSSDHLLFGGHGLSYRKGTDRKTDYWSGKNFSFTTKRPDSGVDVADGVKDYISAVTVDPEMNCLLSGVQQETD